MEVDHVAPALDHKSKAQMWVEKYRPKNVKDVAAQGEVVRSLLGAIEQGALPHLLFYGPPGTGKTSTILAVTRMLYHPDVWRDRVLEMNASDERGIKVVRDKVKAFAQRSVGTATHAGYPSPPFKIIILDEADTMTKDAQGALRRTMETYSSVTRFCLVCNYVSRIIEPLASRCAKFRFSPLDTTAMRERLDFIAREENVSYSDDVFHTILEYSDGDMRRAVTLLQSCVNFYGASGSVTPDALLEVSGQIPPPLISHLWDAIGAHDFNLAAVAVENLMLEGYPALAIITKLHDDVIHNDKFSDPQKARIVERIAEADKCLADGADDGLQLHDVVATIMREIGVMMAVREELDAAAANRQQTGDAHAWFVADAEGVIEAAYDMCAACALVVLISYMPYASPPSAQREDQVPAHIRSVAKKLFWDKVSPDGLGLDSDELQSLCLGKDGQELMSFIYQNGHKIKGSTDAWIQRQLLAEYAPRAGLEIAEFQPQEVDEDGVFAIFCNHNYKRVTVAFRGSQCFLDWEQNAEYRMVPLKVNGEYQGWCHHGFHDVVFAKPKSARYGTVSLYNAVADQLRKEFSKKLLKDDADERRRVNDYSLWVTGHSKGAAIATLFGFVAAQDATLAEVFPGPVTVFSFASPRVGDYEFRQKHQDLEAAGKLRHLRFMNDDDIVPCIPFASFNLGRAYTHVGARVVLGKGENGERVLDAGIEYIDVDHSTNTAASDIFFSSAANHFTWVYLARLDAAKYELQHPLAKPLRVTVSDAYTTFFPDGHLAAGTIKFEKKGPGDKPDVDGGDGSAGVGLCAGCFVYESHHYFTVSHNHTV
ncbi:hypothetical protein CTAYLR_007666 [Chrysophaeum taylorii]|uniref:AAA+ ATPase domain-containing protein n=1 Tax=Chrysophaeum taylorii TaxID=2483200 RepID=A0AAD7U690_9STRA|nr:hypothetical protein CTAYLR_007666 [Chrysophaeum taylorii]